jgi:hypothetical protein
MLEGLGLLRDLDPDLGFVGAPLRLAEREARNLALRASKSLFGCD